MGAITSQGATWPFEQSPDDGGITRWRNPLDSAVRLTFNVGGGRPPRKYTIAPGGELDIPNEYDAAIRLVHRDTGVIVGGQAPMLERVDGNNPRVHPSLIPQFSRE